jgi:hypothetical protein
MTKELSLSEGHYAVCWAHRTQPSGSWVVIDWDQNEKLSKGKSRESVVRGEPIAFIKCIQSRFGEWLARQAAKSQTKSGTFYLVEDVSQLGKDQWPPGGERYQWSGRPGAEGATTKEKELKVFQ